MSGWRFNPTSPSPCRNGIGMIGSGAAQRHGVRPPPIVLPRATHAGEVRGAPLGWKIGRVHLQPAAPRIAQKINLHNAHSTPRVVIQLPEVILIQPPRSLIPRTQHLDSRDHAIAIGRINDLNPTLIYRAVVPLDTDRIDSANSGRAGKHLRQASTLHHGNIRAIRSPSLFPIIFQKHSLFRLRPQRAAGEVAALRQ